MFFSYRFFRSTLKNYLHSINFCLQDEESFRNILRILEGRKFGGGEEENEDDSGKGSNGAAAEKDYWRDGWRAIHDISPPPTSSSGMLTVLNLVIEAFRK